MINQSFKFFATFHLFADKARGAFEKIFRGLLSGAIPEVR